MTDRVIVWQGAIPQDSDLLQSQRNTMASIGMMIGACIGGLAVDGFALTQTTVASLTVNVGQGVIFSQQTIDTSTFGSLPVDASALWKSGINTGATAFTFTAPGTTGQSINYLIQVAFVEADSSPLVLGYYNASNPTQPLNGPAGAGTPQNTARTQRASLSVKAGTAAATGSQATPVPDASNTGLYVVTVAFGQTQITTANLANAQLASAPFLKYKLGNLAQYIQTNVLNYVADSGTANTYVANITPPLTSLVTGGYVTVRIANQNTAASTLNVNGLGAKPIVQYNGSPIVSGALVAGMVADFVYDGNNWQLTNASGRVKLTGALNLYVATTGSDTLNTGLSVGSPFLTIQQAVNKIYRDYDFNGQQATINIANGTYTGAVSLIGQPLGHNQSIIFNGNVTTPASVLINVTSAIAFIANIGCFATVQGITFQASGTSTSTHGGIGYGLISSGGSYVQLHTCAFGACGSGQVVCANGGLITTDATPVTFVAGTSLNGFVSNTGSEIYLVGSTITMTGTPVYSSAFMTASQCGTIILGTTTFTGAATGSRYAVALNGVISLNGVTATNISGSTAGTTSTGGQVS